jgi:hypothetical protein
VELGDGRSGGRRNELGEGAASEPEHGGKVAPAARGRGRGGRVGTRLLIPEALRGLVRLDT